ncbi:MAG TPA: MBL fold metallo-hydrolase, partial [Longimicrobiaceae bacterium]|nr:MBL fold metallo-hydrolase [Longimicrobiaceae bacterium]
MSTHPASRSIAPGVWRVTTPLPFRPREVHAYLLQGKEGAFVLVDGGANTDDAWVALVGGVREVAGEWQRVTAHVVTHMHLDHIGLARRVRDACGAPLLMHRLDAERAAHAEANPEEEAEYRAQLLRESGAPEELIRAIETGHGQAAPLTGFVPADVLLEGKSGALPRLEAWEFLWT